MYRKNIINCVVLLCLAAVVNGQSLINEACTAKRAGEQPNVFRRDIQGANDVTNSFTNNTCTNGTIRWDYPRGALRVSLTFKNPEQQFRVCLYDFFGPRFETIFDVTDDHHRPLQVQHGKDVESELCTSTVSSNIVLLIHAPSFLTYVSQCRYRLDFQ